MEIHFESVDQLKSFWFWAHRMYNKHRFTRQSLGKMFSSVHLHPTSSGARLAFRRRTSCGFCLCFQRGNREFDKTICWCDRRRKAFGNYYNPSQQLWLDAGENRSHSLCTISVNVDCHDEFVVCYGVHAMSRELNFLTCSLEALGSQTVSIIYGIINGKSRALFPETAKSGFTDRRICSDLKKLKGFCCAKR